MVAKPMGAFPALCGGVRAFLGLAASLPHLGARSGFYGRSGAPVDGNAARQRPKRQQER